IKDSITAIFDEIPDPRAFDAATDIAAKVPVRSIADMVGVPAEAGELFEHSMGWNLVRAGNPLYPLEEREEYIQGSLPGLQYLLDMVNERRASKDPGDDFIGTLVTYSEDGDRLTDAEIVSVISALVTAGADTAVDLHAYAVKALIENPSQREILRSRPELGEAAVLEVLRSSGIGKFGGIPRFPYEDMEFGGQKLGKGEWVMALFAPAMIDPAKWGPSAREFDITRDLAGNIVFGAGPHLCIGLNLVKVQGQLMMEEFIRRFGDTAEVAGEITFDPMHFNARRMTSLPVRTGA
ncbi:MAG: cytochrome P450, partial [Streptosporangiales bacterium]|nr:cytochrome P450 [Streptosporangiales bacterium]